MLNMLLQGLTQTPFSLNIIETTSKTKGRVLAVIVSYWNSELKKLVVNHLAAIQVTTGNAQSMFDAMVGLFEKLELPWGN